MRRTFEAYISLVSGNTCGSDVRSGFLHIGECFGFNMKVRDSKYRYETGASDKEIGKADRRVLKRAVLICETKRHYGKECNFQLIIRTIPVRSVCRYNGQIGNNSPMESEVAWRYIIDLFRGFHRHEAMNATFTRRLPTEILREGFSFAHKTPDEVTIVFRYLEDKFKVKTKY